MVDSGRRQLFNPGELPLVILALLEHDPRNGYELMAEMRKLFGGYRPSAGGLYPAKTALAQEGLIKLVDGDGRNRYELTGTGKRALKTRARALAEIESRTGVRIADSASVGPLLARFSARVQRASTNVKADEIEQILDDAAAAIERIAGGSRE